MTYTGFALNYLNKFEIGEAGIVDHSTGKVTEPTQLFELAEGIHLRVRIGLVRFQMTF